MRADGVCLSQGQQESLRTTRGLAATHLVGGGRLLAVDGERHQARGQIDQAADLQVHVAAAGGVSSAGCIAAPNHVAVAALHTGPAETAVSQSGSQSLSKPSHGSLIRFRGSVSSGYSRRKLHMGSFFKILFYLS